MASEEYLPLCNEEGKMEGTALRSVCHDGVSKLLHPVVHLHVFNKTGELYLQKRPQHKDVQPGKWDTAVGGHVDPGETIDQALKRESLEELGLRDFSFVLIKKYIWESDIEKELVHSFSTLIDYDPVFDPEEVDEGRFWGIEEIKSYLGKNVFTPNFEYEFKECFSAL